MDATQVHAEIESKAKKEAVTETRDCTAMSVGQVVRQGDIYIHRVEADHAHGLALKTNQLVPGTSQGSRHVAVGGSAYEGTTLPTWCSEDTILGPCVDGPFTVTHPEHAHCTFGPGRFQITHQMDARTLERVQD